MHCDMKNIFISVIFAAMLLCGVLSCKQYGPDTESLSITGSVDLYHPSDAPGFEEDLIEDVWGPACEIEGTIDNETYGSLTFTVEADNISEEPQYIDGHSFTGTFGNRDDLFEEGQGVTGIQYTYIGDQVLITDCTVDENGCKENMVMLGLPEPILQSGTIKIGDLPNSYNNLIVAEWDDQKIKCVHAVGIGEAEVAQ